MVRPHHVPATLSLTLFTVASTPNAVVICVIIYNAAFGYSWGPIPWLYPCEVALEIAVFLCPILTRLADFTAYLPSERCIDLHSDQLGLQLARR
jgi:hypothetical protein